MADVLVGVHRDAGIVVVVLQWEEGRDPCGNTSPSGIQCALPLDHDRDHVGFPDGGYGMPVRWRNHEFWDREST